MSAWRGFELLIASLLLKPPVRDTEWRSRDGALGASSEANWVRVAAERD